MYPVKQSTTAQPLLFFIAQSVDHISGLTGASPTVTISKAGGSFASPSGSVTEIANGWYKVAGNATDNNTLGPLALHATATSGDPVDIVFNVVAYDPQTATNLGLSALPTANPAASNGLPTVGTGSGQLNPSSGGFSFTPPSVRTGTAQAGASTSITLDSGASSTTDFYKGALVELNGGTGSGQTRRITAYNGTSKVATVSRAWATTPDNTSTFVVAYDDGVATDANLAFTGLALGSTGLDAVVVESGLNARQALSICVSALGGVLAGAATTTITIAAAGVPATNRITATVDTSGNRSAVTLSPPA